MILAVAKPCRPSNAISMSLALALNNNGSVTCTCEIDGGCDILQLGKRFGLVNGSCGSNSSTTKSRIYMNVLTLNCRAGIVN